MRAPTLYAFLRFDGHTGITSIIDGRTVTPLPEGTPLVLDIFISTQSYIRWRDHEIVAEHAKSFFETLDHFAYPEKDGWELGYSLFFRNEDAHYKLRLRAKSGRDQVDHLLRQLADHDLTAKAPVISIGAEPYKRRYYQPVFNIIEWR